jgi:short-subunit dehydrogenase
MKSENMERNKRIFITGGASGLGLALANRYASEGYKVAIGDINDDTGLVLAAEIAQKHQTECKYYHCDVTKISDFEFVAQDLQKHWNGVDVVVNNAGVAASAPIDKGTLEDWDWIININLLGVVRGCKVFTPMFKAQGSGYFINIASMAGIVFLPYMSSYNATKSAVVALSETLKMEFYDSGIGVSVVCPSFFKTNLDVSMRSSERMKNVVRNLFDRSPISADDVAKMIYKGQQAGDFFIITHAKGRTAFWMKKLLPPNIFFKNLYKETKPLTGKMQ